MLEPTLSIFIKDILDFCALEVEIKSFSAPLALVALYTHS